MLLLINHWSESICTILYILYTLYVYIYIWCTYTHTHYTVRSHQEAGSCPHLSETVLPMQTEVFLTYWCYVILWITNRRVSSLCYITRTISNVRSGEGEVGGNSSGRGRKAKEWLALLSGSMARGGIPPPPSALGRPASHQPEFDRWNQSRLRCCWLTGLPPHPQPLPTLVLGEKINFRPFESQFSVHRNQSHVLQFDTSLKRNYFIYFEIELLLCLLKCGCSTLECPSPALGSQF